MLVQRTESPMMLKCELCSYYTKTCFSLNRHTKMVHGSERTVVAPNVNMAAPNANTSAPNVNTLAPNVNTSAPNVNTLAPNVNTLAPNVSALKCSTCYKTFSRPSSLKRHLPKCQGKSHQCACHLCQHVFSHRSALSRHKRTCSKAVQISDESDVSNDSESESSHTENRAF